MVEEQVSVKRFDEISISDVGKTITYINGETIISGQISDMQSEVTNYLKNAGGNTLAYQIQTTISIHGHGWEAILSGPNDLIVTVYSRKK